MCAFKSCAFCAWNFINSSWATYTHPRHTWALYLKCAWRSCVPLRESQFKTRAFFCVFACSKNSVLHNVWSERWKDYLQPFLSVWSRHCFANNLSYCWEVRVNFPFTICFIYPRCWLFWDVSSAKSRIFRGAGNFLKKIYRCQNTGIVFEFGFTMTVFVVLFSWSLQ